MPIRSTANSRENKKENKKEKNKQLKHFKIGSNSRNWSLLTADSDSACKNLPGDNRNPLETEFWPQKSRKTVFENFQNFKIAFFSTLCLLFWSLGGCNSSGRPVGFISTYPGTCPSPWLQVMFIFVFFKKLNFTSIYLTSI